MPAFTQEKVNTRLSTQSAAKRQEVDPDLILVSPINDMWRPAVTVAGWVNEHAATVTTLMAEFTTVIRKWQFLRDRLYTLTTLDPDVRLDDPWKPFAVPKTDDLTTEQVEQAIDRYWMWWKKGRDIAYRIINNEWHGNDSWILLSPEQRERFGCDKAWRVSAVLDDLIGSVWMRPEVPPHFDLKDFMGEPKAIWITSPPPMGMREYVIRGWLQGEPPADNVKDMNDRREAIATAVRERNGR